MKITPINRLKFNNIRYNQNPIVFRGFECSEDSFEIKRVYNLSCPVCGRTMVQQNQIDNFVAECKNAKGAELINLLSKYKKYFHETESKVADILSYEATLYPNLDMLELSGQYLQNHLDEMKIEQLDAVSKIRRLAGNLSQTQKTYIETIIEKYTYIIQNESEKFSKQELENEINKVLPNFHSSRKKISKQISKLPTINDDEYKFLKRYGTKSVAELASRLLTPSLSTCEHIKPKSSGGENNTENYLAECQECNSTRNDTPFGKWIAGKSRFIDNFSKYLNLVAGKIESGEILSDYEDYPADVVRTISAQTGGKVKVEVPEIKLSKDAVELNYEAKIARLKKSIEDLKADLEEARKLQIKAKNSNQFKLYLEYVELKNEKASLLAQKQDLSQRQKKLRSLINEYYTKVIELRDLQQNVVDIANPKEQEKTKSKIVSLKRFISLTKVDEKEEEADELGSQVAEVCLRLNRVEMKLQSITPKINFSSEYQAMINDIKADIFELTGLLEKVSKRNEIKAQIRQLNKQAEEKESKIRELNEANLSLNPNDEEGGNIDEYKKLSMLILRADTLKEASLKSPDKSNLETDSRIYEYAKQTALNNMKKLISKSPAVKRYINLEQIEKLTSELKQIYALIEQKTIELDEFEQIQKKIDSKKSISELQRELSDLNIKLAGAKEVEASVDIEQKIIKLEQEIERRTAILERVENKEMSEEDFIKIISEL